MKKNLVLPGLILAGLATVSYCDTVSLILNDQKTCGQELVSKTDIMKAKQVGGHGVLPPEYLRGVWVENNSKEDVRVMVDGGNIDGYLTIPAGTKKFMDSPTPYAKGLRWKVGASVYKTAKYDKPTRFVIKDGNLYDVTALDKLKDMGSWTALDKSEYFDQKAS